MNDDNVVSIKQQVAQMTPDVAAMRRHVNALFDPVREVNDALRFEITGIHPNEKTDGQKKVTRSKTFPLSDNGYDDAISYAEKLNSVEGFNVYIGLNPRKAESQGRGSADDVAPLFFWQAVDADRQEQINLLKENNQRGLPENLQVITGHHPSPRGHLYWRLDGATANPKAWSDTQQILQAYFGTDKIHDTPRILRLAGSISYPDEKKVAKGYRVEMISLHVHEGRDPVDVIKLRGYFEAKTKAGQPSADASAEAGQPSVHAAGERAYTGSLNLTAPGLNPQPFIDAIRRGEDLHNNARDLTAYLVGIGRSDWEIRTLLEEALRDRSDGGTLREVDQLLGSARQKYNRPDPGQPAFAPPPAVAEVAPDAPILGTSLLGDPPARQWIIDGWLIQNAVSSLYGHGGVGKSLLAQQLMLSVATGKPFLGMPVKQMPVLGLFCEDDKDELHRRHYDLVNKFTLGYDSGLAQAHLWPRVGGSNVLLDLSAGTPQHTPFFGQVVGYLQSMGEGPKLMIVDTLADTFGGSEIDRIQANHFIKTTLGSICLGLNATIILLAHPSRTGLQTGDMLSGSTAWHNAVRSRLTLSYPEEDDAEARTDTRILKRPKANYAQANAEMEIVYKDGGFDLVNNAKTMTEELRDRQLVEEEVARRASQNLPLSPFDRPENSIRKHRFIRPDGSRISPRDVKRHVEKLIDDKRLYVVVGERKRNGLFPVGSTV